MKGKKAFMWMFALILLSIIGFYFDDEISQGFSLIRTDTLTDFFMGITFVSSEIIIFFFLTSLFLWKEHKRRWILPLWISLSASAVVSFILKILVQRQRPFQTGIVSILDILNKANFNTWNFSFPSFQTMFVFCSVPILAKEFPKFKYVWIFFAGLVAISRVYFGLHFFSDVLVGGLIGYLIGVGVIELEKEKKFGERIIEKIF